MDEEIERLIVSVRADTGAFAKDVAAMRSELDGPFASGVERAGLRLEHALTRSIAAAMSAAAARARAERRLDEAWAQRVSATIKCGWWGADVRPGTTITLDDESGRWRVVRATLGDMLVTLELVRAAGAAGIPGGDAEAGRPVREADAPHGATTLRLYDLPLAELASDGGAVLAAMAAGSEPGWRRAALSISSDGGASWRDAGMTAAPAMLGVATSVLAGGGSALTDLAHSVEIELLHEAMVLTGCSEDALAGGANLALLGGELIQFGDAHSIGPKRWRLSRLLRGRRGTEWAAGDHGAGEGFALIEREAMQLLALEAGQGAGIAVDLLASGVGDAEPVEAGLIVSAAALRPPAPVHLRARGDGAGGLQIDWVRRGRAGWSWQSGADTPLGEEQERYAITLTGAGFTRMAETDVPAFHYDAAMRAADGGGTAQVAIAQLGTHGRSPDASITIS